jgi:hypothetical protein
MMTEVLYFMLAVIILMVLPYLFWYKPEVIQSIKDIFI